MANPYKEAEKNQKKAPGRPQGEKKEEKVITAQPEEEKSVTVNEGEEKSIADAFEKRLKTQKKKDTNKVHVSLTLSPEVKAELQKRAKRAGLTASKYLDALLKEDVFKL